MVFDVDSVIRRPLAPVSEDSEILRKEANAQVILAGDVFPAKSLDDLMYKDEDKRFYGMFKFAQARLGTEKEPFPKQEARYELWQFDKLKLLKLISVDTVGVCEHTSKNFETFRNMAGLGVEDKQFHQMTDGERLVLMERTRNDPDKTVFGYCGKCKADFEKNGDLASALLKHYVKETLYIHPFIRYRADAVEGKRVHEKQQKEYSDFRLVYNLVQCTIGNHRSKFEQIRDCYPAGTFDEYANHLNQNFYRYRDKFFNNVVLFDSSRKSDKWSDGDITVTPVSQKKVRRLTRSEQVNAFEVKYSRRRGKDIAEKFASLVKGKPFDKFTANEEPLFCIGATNAGIANEWRKTIFDEIPGSLSRREEFTKTCQPARHEIAAVESMEADAFNDESSFRSNWGHYGKDPHHINVWDKVIKIQKGGLEDVEFVCISSTEFACDILDVRAKVAGLSNVYVNEVREGEHGDKHDFESVSFGDYGSGVLYRTVFEQDLFGDNLYALDINFGPMSYDYGLVEDSVLVSARLESKFELGIPRFPYNLVGKFTSSDYGKKLCDIYEMRVKKVPHPSWFRWFALSKSYWMEKNDKGNDVLKVFWKPSDIETSQFDGNRVTFLPGSTVTRLEFMYIQIEDTTNKKYHEIRRGIVNKLHSLSIPPTEIKLFESKAWALANAGFNTLLMDVRTKAFNCLLGMYDLLAAKEDEHEELIQVVFKCMYDVILGITAQANIGNTALQFATDALEALAIRFKASKYTAELTPCISKVSQTVSQVIVGAIDPRVLHESEVIKYHTLQQRCKGISKDLPTIFSVPLNTPWYLGTERIFQVVNEYTQDDFYRIDQEAPGIPSSNEKEPKERKNNGKNERIYKAVNALLPTEWLNEETIIRAGMYAAQVDDATAKIGYYIKMNKKDWTGLEDFELEDDLVTKKMIRRSIQCLQTALSGRITED